MVTTESVTIKVPVGMSKYLVTMNPETELTRNALLLYPYILNQTISHGRAAEILGIRKSDDDDKIRLNQRKPSKYKGLSRFGPEKNLQRINKFMKERPTFYKKLIQMKENFRFYLRCFYCITKVVILQFNSEKQDRISS